MEGRSRTGGSNNPMTINLNGLGFDYFDYPTTGVSVVSNRNTLYDACPDGYARVYRNGGVLCEEEQQYFQSSDWLRPNFQGPSIPNNQYQWWYWD